MRSAGYELSGEHRPGCIVGETALAAVEPRASTAMPAATTMPSASVTSSRARAPKFVVSPRSSIAAYRARVAARSHKVGVAVDRQVVPVRAERDSVVGKPANDRPVAMSATTL